MAPDNWPSIPPPDFPFEPSTAIRGIAFTGRAAHYTHADTWYPSWASDGNLYSPWTDGNFKWPIADVNDFDCSSDSRNRTNADQGGKSGTGNARITGSDPLRLSVEDLGVQYASPAPYGGRYPCGSLVHNGVWYYGTYCLDESDRGLNWDILGPFVGFRVSRDLGKTWEDTPHSGTKPIFGESGKHGGKVKIGAPHFVDFGKNMEHSPDGKAYLVAHGASRPDAEVAWIAGDEAYLLRVTPSPETINDRSQYEFFAGYQGVTPVWTRDFAQIKPLIQWPGHVGHATMSYVAPLNKYLMFCTDGWPTIETFDTFVLESDYITGPWRLVSYMAKFGEQAYFVNLPTKFISVDGRRAWLSYSANFTNMGFGTHWVENPPGSRYAWCLHEIQFDV